MCWTLGCGLAGFGVGWLVPSLMCLVLPFFISLWGWGMLRVAYAAERRIKRGECYACGYGLAGLPTERAVWLEKPFQVVACPECGRWNGVATTAV